MYEPEPFDATDALVALGVCVVSLLLACCIVDWIWF